MPSTPPVLASGEAYVLSAAFCVAALAARAAAGAPEEARVETAAFVGPGDVLLVVGDAACSDRDLWRAAVRETDRVASRGVRIVVETAPGETAERGLARVRGLLARHRPTVVAVCYGLSDALEGDPGFASRLRSMVWELKAAGARITLVTPPAPSAAGRPEVEPLVRAVETVRSQVKLVAESERVVLADCFGATRAAGGEPPAEGDLSWGDGLHPGPAGIEVMAGCIAAAWKKAPVVHGSALAGKRVAVLGTERTRSKWVEDLRGIGAVELREIAWEGALGVREPGPRDFDVVVFAAGNEHFGTETDRQAEEAAAWLARYVRAGGTLFVLSGGRYPMHYPGQARLAHAAGLRLAFLPESNRCRVVFCRGLLRDLDEWESRRAIRARIPKRGNYGDDVFYRSLAEVRDERGSVVGDAIAVIGPGGELGRGRIVYAACDLEDSPRRAELLEALAQTLAGSVEEN